METINQLVDKTKSTLLNATKNPELLQAAIKECAKNLKFLRTKLQRCVTPGTKKQAACAIGLLTGFRTQMKMMRKNREISKYTSRRVNCEYLQTAFQNRIKTLAIINLTHTDPIDFLDDCQKTFHIRIRKLLKNETALKVNGVFCGEFKIGHEGGEDNFEFKYLNTKNHVMYQDTNINEWFIKNIKDIILKDLEEFQVKQSGWSISAIVNLTMNINKFTPQLGSSYIELPDQIKRKKACVNVKNSDDACFAWSLMAALYPVEEDPQRISKYGSYLEKFNLKGIQFPMTIKQIPRFEMQNTVSINVYILKLQKSGNYITLPTYLSKNKKDNHVNLLLIQNVYDRIGGEEEENGEVSELGEQEPVKYHYVWIKSLSRLLSSQLTNHKGKIYFCDRCLHYFYSMKILLKHGENCIKQNNCKVRLPTNEQKHIQFKNFKNKIVAPFIIYADLECLLKKVANNNIYQNHEPYSIGYYVKCSYDNKLSFYRSYRGEDCVSWFSKELACFAKTLDNILTNPVAMNAITEEETSLFKTVSTCHICEKPFAVEEIRVRDHCHFTGKFRGAAHNNCNINFKEEGHTVPIVFHNLSGYDSHFIIETIASDMPGRVDLLPINKEKYISFTKHLDFYLTKFRFIDSFRFMDKSLDSLSSYLSTFDNLKSEFPLISHDISY